MIFLAPIPAIVALALGLAALLAFYMLKLRRRTVRVSSTMFWESRTTDLQVNVPLRWLRFSLLFLLHLAILGLLAGALGRPAIRGTGASGGVTYLVIDRSASMSATDAGEGRTRLEEAKRLALRAGRRALDSGASGVAVIDFAREARIVAPPTRSVGELERAIASIEATDQAGDLATALSLVEAMATGGASEEEDAPAGVTDIFSDGLSAGDRPLALAGAQARYTRVGPSEERERDNVGIVALGGARDPEDPALVRFFVRAQSVVPERVATTIDVSVDGEETGRTPIVLPAAGDSATSAARTIEVRLAGGGDVRLSLAREDMLASDNVVWAHVEAPRRPGVLVVAPDGKADPFLMDVLGELELRSVRVVAAADYERFAASGLGATDLLVFDRVDAGETPTLPSISFGGVIPGVRAGEEAASTRVITWSRADPVLRDVSLDTVFVAKWRPLEFEEASGARAIAFGDDGPLMVETESGGERRLVVAFELAQSNWSVQFGFAIFMASAVDWLTGTGETGEAWFVTTGEVARAPTAGGEVRLAGPMERVVQAAGVEDGSMVDVGVLERSGVYRAAETPGFALAVNLLDERESTIGTRDALDIAGRKVGAGGGQERERREIWRWFVLLAAGLLVVEWTLAAWRMRV
ncbi:MAG: VWA domain-containing protein [Phycisphaerales bacterium]